MDHKKKEQSDSQTSEDELELSRTLQSMTLNVPAFGLEETSQPDASSLDQEFLVHETPIADEMPIENPLEFNIGLDVPVVPETPRPLAFEPQSSKTTPLIGPWNLEIRGKLSVIDEEILFDLLKQSGSLLTKVDLEGQIETKRIKLTLLPDLITLLLVHQLRKNTALEILVSRSESPIDDFTETDNQSPKANLNESMELMAKSDEIRLLTKKIESIQVYYADSKSPNHPAFKSIGMIQSSLMVRSEDPNSLPVRALQNAKIKLENELRLKAHFKKVSTLVNYTVRVEPSMDPLVFEVIASAELVQKI